MDETTIKAWYAFSGIFTTLKFLELVIGWALAGLIIREVTEPFVARSS